MVISAKGDFSEANILTEYFFLLLINLSKFFYSFYLFIYFSYTSKAKFSFCIFLQWRLLAKQNNIFLYFQEVLFSWGIFRMIISCISSFFGRLFFLSNFSYQKVLFSWGIFLHDYLSYQLIFNAIYFHKVIFFKFPSQSQLEFLLRDISFIFHFRVIEYLLEKMSECKYSPHYSLFYRSPFKFTFSSVIFLTIFFLLLITVHSLFL